MDLSVYSSGDDLGCGQSLVLADMKPEWLRSCEESTDSCSEPKLTQQI